MTALALILLFLAQAEPVVLRGGRVVPVAGPQIESGQVVIAEGKVRAVGAALEVPPGAKLIELPRSSWILPGFIDAHSHLGSAFDVEESTEAITPEARAVEAFTSRHPDARSAIWSGVILAALSPGDGNVVGGQVGVVRLSGERYDLALLKSSVALKASIGRDALRTDREPTSRTGAVALLRKWLRGGKDSFPELPIFLSATFPAEVESALDLAKSSGRKLVLVHARPTDDQMSRLAALHIPVAVEPLTTSDRKDTLELPGRLARAGVRFALVSDAPAIPEDLLRASASFAVKYGLDPKTALEALTTVPAQLLGLDRERGSITEGKAADLVVWSGDPLSLGSEVLLVMIDGRVTWRKAEKP
jgi:imidazolonepropionase-like amidohydrolase